MSKIEKNDRVFIRSKMTPDGDPRLNGSFSNVSVDSVGGGIFVLAGIPMIAVGATPDDPPAPRIGLSVQPTGATFEMAF